MANTEGLDELWSKGKAVSTLLPYGVWRERDGEPEMLDTVLHAARASRMLFFIQRFPQQFVDMLFSKATPRAVILVSPYIVRRLGIQADSVQRWAAEASAVQYTEEAARDVVDTLFQIASNHEPLLTHVTTDIWAWLKKRPSLPPGSGGRYYGSHPNVFRIVRGLKDTEVLKSYFLICWSEWVSLWYDHSPDEMCAPMREDFGGIGMGHHRADLIQRLDHILRRLDRGPEYLTQHDPRPVDLRIYVMKYQYGGLKDTLLEMNIKAVARMYHPIVMLFHILTQADIHRIPRNIYVCASSPMSVASRLELSASLFHFICKSTSIPTFIRIPVTPVKRTLLLQSLRWVAIVGVGTLFVVI